MPIFAVRIGLPDFDQRIVDRLAVPILDPALDRDLLSGHAWTDQVVGDEPREPDMQIGSHRL
jgi:hypothetical protein